jgi:pyrimidine-specific ribonucleoside hydrolase
VIKRIELRVPEFERRTAEIIWSCSNFNHEECFNYTLDKDAYRKINRSNTKLSIIDGKSLQNQLFPKDLTSNIPGAYASGITRSLELEHKIFYDEIIPLWLHYPQMFEVKLSENFEITALKETLTEANIQDAFLQIIKGETVNQNQVINFSWNKDDYFEDIQPIMDETVIKYGKDEWVACVMANEMHRHLGIFAIVGAKMGIRAKEYFGAGVDEMKVVSYAGIIPPFSCMNDGLQISTGATIGHGLISVSPDTLVRPVADFTYMGRKIRLILKPEVGKKIASEVKELNSIYGLNSDIYWELIRRLAIKYWSIFDRQDIFIIQEIK